MTQHSLAVYLLESQTPKSFSDHLIELEVFLVGD